MIKAYPGDARTRKLLDKHRAIVSLEELKAAMMGAILAPDMVPPSAVLSILHDQDDEGPEFESKDEAVEWMQTLMGLWNELGKHQDTGNPFAFSTIPAELEQADPAIIQNAASRRAAEMGWFLDFLEEGGLWVGDEKETKSREELENYLPLVLSAGIRLIETQIQQIEAGDSSEARMIPPAIRMLDERFESLYPDFVAEMKARRMEYIAQHAPSDDEERLDLSDMPSEKVGRNNPCPCGSGKKYKKCCLTSSED